MYKKIKATATTIKVNDGYEGETIEQKVQRILSNKEPIKDRAPAVYTERKEGVRADTNIRTDRFELAVEATDKITKHKIARREGKLGDKAKEGMNAEEKTGGSSSAEGAKGVDKTD